MHKYGFQGNFWIVVVLLIFIEPFVRPGRTVSLELDIWMGISKGDLLAGYYRFNFSFFFPPPLRTIVRFQWNKQNS